MSDNKTVLTGSLDATPIRQTEKASVGVDSYSVEATRSHIDNEATAVGADSPLLFASKEIFKETYKLMHMEYVEEIEGTSRLMEHEINKFSNLAMEQGVPQNQIMIAQYLMVTFVDEMLGGSSWGSSGDWAGVSLLGKFFKEGEGGDKFFDLLNRFETNPTENIYLMELAYVCLSFGYGGKYKKQTNRIEDLGAIKENLYRQIKTTKPKKEKFYVNHPVAQRHHKLYSKLSRKIILAVALLLMVVIYGVFTYTVQSNETVLINIIQEEHSKIKDTHGTNK